MGKISFTMNTWTDLDMNSYMGVTAHWVQKYLVQTPCGNQEMLRLRADLIGFIAIPGSHTGEHLAEIFMFVINRLDIAKKVRL
jgi:hypothetical protein